MCIIGPRSHKASKADRLRGKVWKIVKRVSGNNIRELRYSIRVGESGGIS